jgi:hypothetical protein
MGKMTFRQPNLKRGGVHPQSILVSWLVVWKEYPHGFGESRETARTCDCVAELANKQRRRSKNHLYLPINQVELIKATIGNQHDTQEYKKG